MVNYQDWWNMIPDTKRVVVVGETGDVPRPFKFSKLQLKISNEF